VLRAFVIIETKSFLTCRYR